MAILKYVKSKIVGLAAGVPKDVVKAVPNSDKYSTEDYVLKTGVAEKRYSEEFTTSDLCYAATERLLSDLNWDKKEIDAIFFVSQTPDYILPATSCVLHGRLGLKKDCMALDISLGCSGWVYGLATALSFCENSSEHGTRKILLMAGDARKQCKVDMDPLFGYAGTVTAIEHDEYNTNPIMIDLGTDGTGYEAIITPGGGTRNPFTEDSLKPIMCEDGRMRHPLQTRMNGMDVFSFGITTVPKAIKKLANEFGLDYASYDYFIFHQANKKMIETIRHKLKLPQEKVPYSLTHFGNTSSASIPLTLVTQLKDPLRAGDLNLMCCGFGVGLSWGTVALKTSKIVVSDLIEL